MKCRCNCIWSKDGECKSRFQKFTMSDTTDGDHVLLICESQMIVDDDHIEVDFTT